jgi:RND family efflux transporter MFP subunit
MTRLAILARLASAILALAMSDAMAQGEPGRQARALLAADNEATLSADGPLLIQKINVDVGDRFAAGDKLIEFDCTLRRARVAAATGVHQGAVARLASKQRLQQTGTIGALEVELARADAQKAEGELAEMRDAAARCVILAPYAGRVARRHANAHEVVGADRGLLTIVSDGPLRVKTLVPSTWLRWLRTGSTFEVAVDEAGKAYRAKIVAIAGKVDAESQSIELLGRIEGEAGDLLPGMSGVARFPGQRD